MVEVSSKVAVAVSCGLVAALAYALSNVLQQHEAEQVPDESTLRLGLLTELARRPRWLVGIGADVAGYVYEALALGAGTLVLVEPILATALIFSLMFGSVLHGRRVSRQGWVAAVLLAASVSLFLAQVKPSGGASVAPLSRWIVAGPIIAAVEIGFVAVASRQSGGRRAALLSCAAGVAFGVSAVLTKGFVHYLGQGPLAWAPHFEPYGLAASSITGLVLAQSAFQSGSLAAAVGAEQVMQPLAGVVLGVALLGEQISAADPLNHLVAAVALGTMLWSGVILAQVEHPTRPATSGPAPAD